MCLSMLTWACCSDPKKAAEARKAIWSGYFGEQTCLSASQACLPCVGPGLPWLCELDSYSLAKQAGRQVPL